MCEGTQPWLAEERGNSGNQEPWREFSSCLQLQTLPHTLELLLPPASGSRGALGETVTFLGWFSSPSSNKNPLPSPRNGSFLLGKKKKKSCLHGKDSFYIFQYFSVCLPSCAIKDFTCSILCFWFGPKRSPETFSGVKRGQSSTISEEKHRIL